MRAGYIPYGQLVCHDGGASAPDLEFTGDRRRLPVIDNFPDAKHSNAVYGEHAPSFGTFSGGLCRADPAMIDALIATLVNLQEEPVRSDVDDRAPVTAAQAADIIAQSWLSVLQLAQSQGASSCGQQKDYSQCWCSSDSTAASEPESYDIDDCIATAVCMENSQLGWRCDSAQDPASTVQLAALVQQHAAQTLIEWARYAGFAPRSIDQHSFEPDSTYRERLIDMLVKPLSQGRYENLGHLGPDDLQSAAYAQHHGCPVNTFLATTHANMCVRCPNGKQSLAGSIDQSACKPSQKHKSGNLIEQESTGTQPTGTPFPDCMATGECEIIQIDTLEHDLPFAVLAMPPKRRPSSPATGPRHQPENNRTSLGPAISSSTWQFYITSVSPPTAPQLK